MDMDTLPFFILGKGTVVLTRTDTMLLRGTIHKVQMYDLDKDGIADEFHVLSKEGKPSQDFGFLYNPNRDGMVDYIVFWGGIAITRDQEVYKYTYHWVDEDYDGNIDMETSSVAKQPGDSLPDPHYVLLVRDMNADGAAEEVSFMHLPGGVMQPVALTNGKSYCETMFGRREIDPADRQHFAFYNRVLSKFRKI
jgi:hypothetical protein